VVTPNPATVLFSIGLRNGQKKDTQRNIEEHPEFAFNLVMENFAQKMNNCATDFLPEVSEFGEVGLTAVPAKTIACSVVQESPIHLECKLDRILPVGTNVLILGTVLCFDINDNLLLEGNKIDGEQYKPLGRIGDERYGIIKEFFSLEKDSFDPDKQLQGSHF
jgi:flavin reductase (DIM6/NTAB) family NADH-FMN oxidoreductase RutF